ncbi:hypothetical protein, partial [Planomicrobium okeanokoites]|uniref:hypothetical protein n=1 Tax=Planomicrobium okeanokoites TaxID=244 RepID=UPI00248F7593
MRKCPFSSERHKTNQRSGPDRAAELAYDPKSWAAGVWTTEKRKRPFSSERHKTNQRSGPDRAAELAYDPKSWAAGV